MTSTQSSQVFLPHFENREPMDECLYKLEVAMQESKRPDAKKNLAKRHLTPLEVLAQIRDYLTQGISNMSVDYISLVRTCNMLLRRIRAAISRKVDFAHTEKKHEDTNQPGQIIMVFCILHEANETQFLKETVIRSRMRLPEGPQLEVSGKVMQGWLDSKSLLKKIAARGLILILEHRLPSNKSEHE